MSEEEVAAGQLCYKVAVEIKLAEDHARRYWRYLIIGEDVELLLFDIWSSDNVIGNFLEKNEHDDISEDE